MPSGMIRRFPEIFCWNSSSRMAGSYREFLQTRFNWSFIGAIRDTSYCFRQIAVPVGGLGVCVFAFADILTSLRGGVDTEVVEGVALDLVGVLMAFAVIATQSEEPI